MADECLDGNCFQLKVSVHIDRQVAAHPGLMQIENGFRSPKEQRPGAVRRGHYREIEAAIESPDAEPVAPCSAAKPAIIVFGKRAGTTLTVCTDHHCPVHDPRAATPQTTKPTPAIAPTPEIETDEEREEAEERQRNYEQQQKEYAEKREQRAEQRRLEEEREEQEYAAERARIKELQKARTATFEHILSNAPAVLSAAQLRVTLRALLHLDPYTLVDDVAEHFAGQENHRQTAEEILLSALYTAADDKLAGFALRLVLTGHTSIPHDGEIDFLAKAEAAFAVPVTVKKAKTPGPARKKNAGKKKTAA